MTTTLQERIAKVMATSNLKPADLVRITGKSRAAISLWINGPTNTITVESAAPIQNETGYSAIWIATGRPPEKVEDKTNVVQGPAVRNTRGYPLISWVQAGGWAEICDNFHPGDADEWRHSHKDLGRCGYMLRVSGASMTAGPDARYSFPEGMLLHVKPDVDPTPGQFVIVRRDSEKAATFKKLTLVDGEMYLEAINPDWPHRFIKLQEGDVFCGVVVHAGWDMP